MSGEICLKTWVSPGLDRKRLWFRFRRDTRYQSTSDISNRTPRPPWVRCAQQCSCVRSVWEKKSNCCPGEESHVGSCRGLGGGLTSDAVGTCRLRRTGPHLLTGGWVGH